MATLIFIMLKRGTCIIHVVGEEGEGLWAESDFLVCLEWGQRTGLIWSVDHIRSILSVDLRFLSIDDFSI